MATRKPFYNKCEVIDYIGEVPITPSILFGYSKIDNFASVYREDGLVLTPIQNGKLDGFEDGDRLLFRVRKEHTGAVTLSIGSKQYELVGMDGQPLPRLSIGYVAAEFKTDKFYMSEETLDEADYVYCDFIIAGCVSVAERYMGRDITAKKYRAFRNDLTGDYIEVSGLYDDIDGVVFELRDFIVDSTVKVSVTDNSGQVSTVDNSLFYVYRDKLVYTGSETYSTGRLGAVAIEFEVMPDLPDDLCSALLQHASEAYESRGMCTSETCPAALAMGDGVKAVYNMYKKLNIGS